MALQNPLLDFFNRSANLDWYRQNRARDQAIVDYAYGVPTGEVIQRLVAMGPLVEMGAGRGYWAWLVHQAGGDIIAYDVAPPPNSYTDPEGFPARTPGLPQTYVEVLQGAPKVLARNSDRTLFICWGAGVLKESLLSFQGEHICIVQDDSADMFMTSNYVPLDGWVEECRIPLPNWYVAHDEFCVYRRAPVIYIRTLARDVRVGDEVQNGGGGYERVLSITSKPEADRDFLVFRTPSGSFRLVSEGDLIVRSWICL